MEEVVNRFARELADAVASAVAQSADVEACRTRARESGYEMQLKLEAVVGFAARAEEGVPVAKTGRKATRRTEMTANDRRFLRSLRIAADEAASAKAD